MPKHYNLDDAEKLTPSAIELLNYVYTELKAMRCPTHMQMAHALGLKSVGYVNRLLSQLRKGGFVVDSENKRVGIERVRVEELLSNHGYNTE